MQRIRLGLLLSCCVLSASLRALAVPLEEIWDWDRVMRPDVSFADGMLAADLLIVHFAAGANPEVGVGKSGEIVTSQLALDAVNRAVAARRFERLFVELPAQKQAEQPAGRELLWLVQFDAGISLRAAAERYAALPNVSRVEPVGFHHFTAEVPNDPQLASQPWLRATTIGPKDIRAISGWYHAKGSESVVIAIADSGVDWQHPDLGGTGPDYLDGSIWDNSLERNGNPSIDDDGNGKIDDVRGWDFIDFLPGGFPAPENSPSQDASVEDADPMDYEGHGTLVAGCAGATTNNGVGVAGASWGCAVMPLRIGYLPDGASVGIVGMHWAARAMDYARIKGARVFNASWGSSDSGGLGTATTAAINAGIVIVTAAGNDNDETASYLASRSNVLSVAAVNGNDVKAGFSSYGTWVDVSAPGVSVYATTFNRFGSGGTQHTYGSASGTSFASPIVAGVVGLYRSFNPAATGAVTRAAIIAAVDDIDALNPGFVGKLGSGRINIGKLFGGAPWKVPEVLPTFVDAINTAEPGDEIRVLGGASSLGQLVLPQKTLTISGAWDGSYASRDVANNRTILSGNGAYPPILGQGAISPDLVVDGFEITGGAAGVISLAPIDGRYGGGILLRNGASPTLKNLLVHGNIAGQFDDHGGGGAVAVLNASPLFEDCEFTGNSASQGSAIYVYGGSPIFRRVDVHDNISYGTGFGLNPRGGAVYVIDTATKLPAPLRFEGGTLSGHDVAGPGGALFAQNSAVECIDMVVEGNSADSDGGAFHLQGGSLLCHGSTFSDNSIEPGTNKSGGGIYAIGATIDIQTSHFLGNSASFGGGGVALDGCSGANLSGNFVAANSAALLASGVYLSNCTNTTLSSNTVVANFGASAGANGVYVAGGSATVSNNIFALNGSAGVSLADGFACGGGSATFACNLAWSNTAGNYSGCPDPTGSNGNVTADPLFCDAPQGDYRIAVNSPAAAAQSGCGDIGAGAVGCGATGVEDPELPVAELLVLRQNRPNPFNPSTRIEFRLPESGPVRLSIHDLRGKLIRTLIDAELPAGEHGAVWDGRDVARRHVASGVYMYQLLFDGKRVVRKMGLIK
jgi:subtilisin family serine protease